MLLSSSGLSSADKRYIVPFLDNKYRSLLAGVEAGGFIPKDPKKEKHQVKEVLEEVLMPENKAVRVKLAQHIDEADTQQIEAVNKQPA